MTDSAIFIRQAEPFDAEKMTQHHLLSQQEASQYRGFLSVLNTQSDTSLRLVGGIGSTVMGSLTASNQENGTWTIESVFVEEECRTIGIGDALVIACLKELQQRQATWVQSRALPGDRATKNLFERHGLVAQTIIVGKKV